ncbi:MAG: exosortase/archaeosortase family protein [Candidatus Heimdallarchaeaceae archaeon]
MTNEDSEKSQRETILIDNKTESSYEEKPSFFQGVKIRSNQIKKSFKAKQEVWGEKLSPITKILKNRILRYTISIFLIALVVYFYVLYETVGIGGTAKVFFFYMKTNALVPLGLLFAFLAIMYVSWDDQFFKKYRKPALYVVLLTTVFYVFIFTDVSIFLFELRVAKWLTEMTGLIVPTVLRFFGMNITEITWFESSIYTRVSFDGPSDASAVLIDPRCSGIHSLTVFIAIFLIMLFEARNRLDWNYKVALVTLAGIVGTYIMNLIRIGIVLTVFYYSGNSIGESVHNYLGYVFLVIWLPIFWMFILPLAEKDRKRKRRDKKKTSVEEKNAGNSDNKNRN